MVQVSGRRRFNIVSASAEQQSGQEMYQQIIQEYQGRILSPSHPQHKLVQRVLNRLIPHSGLPAETNNWEVHVIKDEQKNAFVIPGGKVFVFSGILEVCQGEPGLAAVLGHEIAHVRKLKVQFQRASLACSVDIDEVASRTPSH